MFDVRLTANARTLGGKQGAKAGSLNFQWQLATVSNGNWASVLDDMNLGSGWVGDGGAGSQTIFVTAGDSRPTNTAYAPRIHV